MINKTETVVLAFEYLFYILIFKYNYYNSISTQNGRHETAVNQSKRGHANALFLGKIIIY